MTDKKVDVINAPLSRWRLLRLVFGSKPAIIKIPQGEGGFEREAWIFVRRKRNGIERLVARVLQQVRDGWPRR